MKMLPITKNTAKPTNMAPSPTQPMKTAPDIPPHLLPKII